MYKLDTSVFTISLDLELMWGVFDKRNINNYGTNIDNVKEVVPKILNLFLEYNINATWAIVGCLNFLSLEDLLDNIPKTLPRYNNQKLSAYSHMQKIKKQNFSKYYSAVKLISMIKSRKTQEIATHTFSHYYCLEDPINDVSFKEDIVKAISVSNNIGIETKSIIFPRNQYYDECFRICMEEGIIAYRGNENNFLQRPRNQNELNLLIRALRFADSYINITGFNIYDKLYKNSNGLVNIPSSFFFRPYARNKILEYCKIKRYKSAMLSAAKNQKLFHLWWHPHNFGKNMDKNLFQLKEILDYYSLLNKKYEMKSMNMSQLASKVINNQ